MRIAIVLRALPSTGGLSNLKRASFALFACFCFSACGMAEHKGAKALLERIYKDYQNDFITSTLHSAYADSILAPELLELVHLDRQRPEGDGGLLNWDPLCDCQDPEGVTIDTIMVSAGPDSANGEVWLGFFDSVKVISFKLVLLDHKWLISDIGSKSNPSLYHYLRANLIEDPSESFRKIKLRGTLQIHG